MGLKHAIITGGSSGIGLALAQKLAAQGYNLSLIARREHLLAECANSLKPVATHDDQAIDIYPADVSDAAQADAAVKNAISRRGSPDLLITSAGVAVPGYFEEQSAGLFDQAMAVNYFGTLHVIRAALASMRARGAGRIVLICSGAAFMGIYGYSSYGPSKFAVRGLAETLRAELRPSNIGVSIAYPPDTETPMLVEENKTKPEETKLITGLAAAWTANDVADCILRGVARGAFAITPGFVLTLMHRMPGIMIPVLGWYCDRLVDGVRNKAVRAQAKAA